MASASEQLGQLLDIREQICDIGRRLVDRGLVVANQGNISARVDNALFLCTPSGRCKGKLQPEDICLMDINGKIVDGRGERSTEALLHLEIYRQSAQAQAVVHSHPPHALAFAVTHRAIPQGILAEFDAQIGAVPLVPYATAGTVQLADRVAPFVKSAHTMMLANHGVVSYGDDLEQAFVRTELFEHYCRVLLLAEALGPLVPIE